MGEAARNLEIEPVGPPRPGIRLIQTDSPEGPFFTVGGNIAALDMDALRKRVAELRLVRPTLHAILESLEIMPSAEQAQEATSAIEAFKKGKSDEELDVADLTPIAGSLATNGLRLAILKTTEAAEQVYMQNYWGDYAARKDRDGEKLMELYDRTDAYEGAPLLVAISGLKQAAPNQEALLLETEQVARILIENEVTPS